MRLLLLWELRTLPCSEVTHGALLGHPLPDGVMEWDTPWQGKAGEASGASLGKGA